MNSRQAQIAIHVTAVLFSLTGIFGELIQASAMLISAGRASFATLALLFFMLQARHRPPSGTRPRVPFKILLPAGLLLGTHWVTFFISVKISGVAIATLGLASFPAFITLLEGFLFKEETRASEWMVVSVVTAGLVLVTPSFDFHDQATIGLAWAVLSGLTFALYTLINRKAVTQMPAREVAGWENLIVAVLALPWCLTEFTQIRLLDCFWLFLLGVFCTALSHSLLVSCLTKLKARTAGVILTLEPVYAIVFAAVLFAQYPSVRAILGGVLIIGAIIWSGLHRTATLPAEAPSAGASPAGNASRSD